MNEYSTSSQRTYNTWFRNKKIRIKKAEVGELEGREFNVSRQISSWKLPITCRVERKSLLTRLNSCRSFLRKGSTF